MDKLLILKRLILFCAFISSSFLFGQKAEIESFINEVIFNELPDNFRFYHLFPKSIEHPLMEYPFTDYRISKIKLAHPDFPLSFVARTDSEIVDWRDFDLENVRFLKKESTYFQSPSRTKYVLFVDYGISGKEYDSLFNQKESYEIIVRKKRSWKTENIWKNKKFHDELVRAWEIDEERNPEKTVYYQISTPIFSDDFQYAKISLSSKGRCGDATFSSIYEKVDGKWKKLKEYIHRWVRVGFSHGNCEDMSIVIK